VRGDDSACASREDRVSSAALPYETRRRSTGGGTTVGRDALRSRRLVHRHGVGFVSDGIVDPNDDVESREQTDMSQ